MSFYETREMHKKEILRTRWYHATYADVKKAIFEVADELGYAVVDVNDTYQEFLLEGRAVLVIKVCSYSRYEQGIDFNITTKSFFDFGAGRLKIKEWYDRLGRHLHLKGISLHP